MRLIYDSLHLLIQPNDVSTRMQHKHFVSSHKNIKDANEALASVKNHHYALPLADVFYSIHYFLPLCGTIFIIHFMPSSTIPLGPHSYTFFSITMFECLREWEQKASRHFALTRTTNLLRSFMPSFIPIPLTFHSATCLETSAPAL